MKLWKALIVMAGMVALASWSWAAIQNHAAHQGHAAAETQAAHQHAAGKAALCEVCGKPILPASEVTVQESTGGPVHHYRCTHCAFLAARDWLTHDLTMQARSSLANSISCGPIPTSCSVRKYSACC